MIRPEQARRCDADAAEVERVFDEALQKPSAFGRWQVDANDLTSVDSLAVHRQIARYRDAGWRIEWVETRGRSVILFMV